MKELIGAVLVMIIAGVAIMIGGAMIAKTENVTNDVVGNTYGNASDPYPIITTLGDDTESALTTLTSLLPILALAVIGGLALFYLLGFMRTAV